MKVTPQIIYTTLIKEFGNLKWWPMDLEYHKKNDSDPRYEVIVGAILTQNTAWSNVEKALDNLKSKNLLDIENISRIKLEQLKDYIKPSGFFNQKAKRLKDFTLFISKKYHGDLDNFFNKNLFDARGELLSINGIGPETADSILLYAGNKPIFVVDAYTKRINSRLPLIGNSSYDEIQSYFQRELSNTNQRNDLTQIYNELHALIVEFAKNYCKKKPDCKNCPLGKYCSYKTDLFQQFL
jgi:endonuclease-3 related protein